MNVPMVGPMIRAFPAEISFAGNDAQRQDEDKAQQEQ